MKQFSTTRLNQKKKIITKTFKKMQSNKSYHLINQIDRSLKAGKLTSNIVSVSFSAVKTLFLHEIKMFSALNSFYDSLPFRENKETRKNYKHITLNN